MTGTATPDEPEREPDDTVEMDPVADQDVPDGGEQLLLPGMRRLGENHPPARPYALYTPWCTLQRSRLARIAASVAHRLMGIGGRIAPSAA
jgi:hypothetical protein